MLRKIEFSLLTSSSVKRVCVLHNRFTLSASSSVKHVSVLHNRLQNFALVELKLQTH